MALKKLLPLISIPLLLTLTGCSLAIPSEPISAPSPTVNPTSVVGIWAETEGPQSWLEFTPLGGFNGFGGCNTVLGDWTQFENTVTLDFTWDTGMLCYMVYPSWLTGAEYAEISEGELVFYSSTDDELGVMVSVEKIPPQGLHSAELTPSEEFTY